MTSRATEPQATQSSPSVAPLMWIAALPLSGRLLGLIGAAVSIAGVVIAVASGPWTDPVGAVVRGGFLVPLGAGLFGLALAKAYLERNAGAVDRLAVGPAVDDMLRQLKELLAPGSSQQTVEWIQRMTQLPEPTVVRLLSILRDRGELSEELDSDNGEFFYRITRSDPLDLDTRLATVNRRRV